MNTAINSAITSWLGLKVAREKLIAKGYGAPGKAPPAAQKTAAQIRVIHRGHTGTKAEVKTCALCAEDADVSLAGAESDKLSAMDVVDCGRLDAAKNKRDVLLCADRGLTHKNMGTTAYLQGITDQFSSAVSCMQTVTQPITHCFPGARR